MILMAGESANWLAALRDKSGAVRKKVSLPESCILFNKVIAALVFPAPEVPMNPNPIGWYDHDATGVVKTSGSLVKSVSW